MLFHRYEGLIKNIDMLRDCKNTDFVWELVPRLKKIKMEKDDTIYREGDFSEEIYFIKTGKIKLVALNGYSFAYYNDGMHFGDNDVI